MENVVGCDLFRAIAMCKMKLNIPHYVHVRYTVRNVGTKLTREQIENDKHSIVFWMLNGAVHRAPILRLKNFVDEDSEA